MFKNWMSVVKFALSSDRFLFKKLIVELYQTVFQMLHKSIWKNINCVTSNTIIHNICVIKNSISCVILNLLQLDLSIGMEWRTII